MMRPSIVNKNNSVVLYCNTCNTMLTDVGMKILKERIDSWVYLMKCCECELYYQVIHRYGTGSVCKYPIFEYPARQDPVKPSFNGALQAPKK
jgi:hypothetical protein